MTTTHIPLDFQPGSEADQCPVCYKSFLLADLPVHIDFCLDSDPTMSRCPICDEKIPRAVLSDHAETCASSAPFAPTVDVMCPVCHEQYPVELIEEHVGICMGDEEEDGRNVREDEDSDAADDRMVDALSIRLATTFPTHAAASTGSVAALVARDLSENKYDPTVLTSPSPSPLPMTYRPMPTHLLATTTSIDSTITTGPTAAAVTSFLARSTRKRKALITASSSSSVLAPIPAATFVAPAPVLSTKAQGKRPRLELPPTPSSGTCPICHKRYRTSTHVPACQAKLARTQPKLSKEDSLLTQLELDELLAIELTRPLMASAASAASGDQILTPANLAALTHVHNCAKRDSHAARAQLIDRFRDILDLKAVANSRSHTPIYLPNIPPLPVGMDAMALYKATTEWIRNRGPIIVHVQLDVLLKHMAVDTHYRNYFEVAEKGDIKDQSYGSGRKTWETRMFGGAYDRVPNVERPKYGVLNPVADPRGIQSCISYGDSYMILRVHTRYRATFAAMDSASNGKLATCEFYNHILLSYSPAELQAVSLVALGRLPHYSSTGFFSQYKELQIHGPLEFARDVERLVVHERYRDLRMDQTRSGSSRYGGVQEIDGERFWKWLREFQDRCPNVDVVWMDTGVGVWVDQL